jgi:putative Mg2+ transporter-C (MgtC) family protein
MSFLPSLLDTIQHEFAEFADWQTLVKIAIRLVAAALAGGLIGLEREKVGKAAGLRTHMLVTIGTAMFVIVPVTQGAGDDAVSRVIQGIVTGIGFLGGGAILKLSQEKEIHGLTTAAGIWLAAAIGIAIGFGRLGTALFGTLFALVVLRLLAWVEPRLNSRDTPG